MNRYESRHVKYGIWSSKRWWSCFDYCIAILYLVVMVGFAESEVRSCHSKSKGNSREITTRPFSSSVRSFCCWLSVGLFNLESNVKVYVLKRSRVVISLIGLIHVS